ncbi:MAG: prepilin-type N-terminal cleavage/methylation domain-containing protein [Bdellovibrionaceae bacterium]|nr:prepilin-type N-terminal cleavage/methylation domain-containing protein [Pseudobdellovibrionaceae bacterium]
MRPQRGFTLLELVIVMGLLAFLTINIALNIDNAFKARGRIQVKLEDFSQMRDSLKIMERDFNLAFHYRDLEEEFRAALKKAQKPAAPATPPGAPPPPPGIPPATPAVPEDPSVAAAEQARKQNRVDPTTHFIGNETKVDFVSGNTARMAYDQQQADFIEVGYELKNCRRPGADRGSNCLVRRESTMVEGKVQEGGSENVLLEDVSEFRLRYFGQGKQDWNTEWNSEQGDAATKNNYPQAVEISLSIERGEDGKKRKVSMQVVAAVRFPNNAPPQNQQGSPSTPTGIPTE